MAAAQAGPHPQTWRPEGPDGYRGHHAADGLAPSGFTPRRGVRAPGQGPRGNRPCAGALRRPGPALGPGTAPSRYGGRPPAPPRPRAPPPPPPRAPLCFDQGALLCSGLRGSLLMVCGACRKLRGGRAAGLVQPAFDGPDGNPEFQRGLGMSEPLPVEGEDRRPLARCQRRDRLAYTPGHFGGFSPLRRPVLSIGILLVQPPRRYLPEQAPSHVLSRPAVPAPA